MDYLYTVLKLLYENIDVGVVLHRSDISVLQGNPAAGRLLGLSQEQLTDISPDEIAKYCFDESGNAMSWQDLPFHKALDGDKNVQNTVIRLKGINSNLSRCVQLTVYPVPDGNVECALVSMIRDITETTEISESMRRNQAFLQLILDSIPQHIFWKNTDSIYQGSNALFAEAAGVGEPENIVGKTDFDLAWKKEEAEAFRADDRYVMNSNQPKLHIIEPQRQSDGKEAWLETNKIPLKDDSGNVTGVLGTFQDITELIETRKKVEELLRTENDRLEKLVGERTAELESTMKELMKSERLASLGSLVAGVAHEINTPLGVSVSAGSYLRQQNTEFFEDLEAGNIGKDDLIEYVKMVNETSDIINANLFRAAELVRSFKDISTTQTADMRTQFDLREYVDSLILTLKHEYKRTHHTFSIQPDTPVWLDSYPSDFSQVFTNLIMNSLHHAFPQDYAGSIEIRLEDGPDSIQIVFADDGRGIAPDVLERIFDPFFTTNRQNGGSGLGLSIVYNIIHDNLDGTIKCESAPGEGCKFTMVIPHFKDRDDE